MSTPIQPGMHGPNEVTIVGYDPITKGWYPLLISSVQTDTTGQGETYGVLQVAGVGTQAQPAATVNVGDKTNIGYFLSVDANGRIGINNFPVSQTVNGTVSVNSLPSLPVGNALIGHVLVDSAANVSVTLLPALVAGVAHIGSVNVDNFPTSSDIADRVARLLGHVNVDNFPGVQPVSGSIGVSSLPSLPAGASVIGHVLVDSANINAMSPLVASNAMIGHVVNDGAAAGAVIPSNTLGAAIAAATDYSITFPTQVNHFALENNSTNVIQWEADAATSAGSLHLSNLNPGNMLVMDVKCTTIHVSSPGATTFGAGINARGWA